MTCLGQIAQTDFQTNRNHHYFLQKGEDPVRFLPPNISLLIGEFIKIDNFEEDKNFEEILRDDQPSIFTSTHKNIQKYCKRKWGFKYLGYDVKASVATPKFKQVIIDHYFSIEETIFV